MAANTRSQDEVGGNRPDARLKSWNANRRLRCHRLSRRKDSVVYQLPPRKHPAFGRRCLPHPVLIRKPLTCSGLSTYIMRPYLCWSTRLFANARIRRSLWGLGEDIARFGEARRIHSLSHTRECHRLMNCCLEGSNRREKSVPEGLARTADLHHLTGIHHIVVVRPRPTGMLNIRSSGLPPL